MHYICLDTNAWIYLANGLEPVKILHFIDEQVRKGTITLLVPELTTEEWMRNKPGITKDVLKELNSATENLKRLTKAISERTADAFEFLFTTLDVESLDEEAFENISRDIQSKRKKLEEAIEKNIKVVEELFGYPSTIKLPTTEQSKLQSAELALKKKAPFVKKNSFADAVILMVFCNYLKENNIFGGMFISYNSEDYCIKENGKKHFHPDLQPFLDDIKGKFYTVIGEAINTVETILTEQEMARIKEVQDDWTPRFCEVCEGNRRHSDLFFSQPFEIENENKIELLPSNDMEIPFKNITKPQRKAKEFIHTIQMAQCSYCGTDHYLCEKCGSMNCLWDHMYNERTECEGCGTPYFFDRSGLWNGGELKIRVLEDLKVCQSCNEEFEDLSDSNLCTECEEHYGTN
jgi:hypothetical protein